MSSGDAALLRELPDVLFLDVQMPDAVDSLLKPVEPERLARTVERLRRGQARLPPAALALAMRRIPCQGARSIKLVDLAEVESVRTRSGQTVPVSRRFLPLLKQRLGV